MALNFDNSSLFRSESKTICPGKTPQSTRVLETEGFSGSCIAGSRNAEIDCIVALLGDGNHICLEVFPNSSKKHVPFRSALCLHAEMLLVDQMVETNDL